MLGSYVVNDLIKPNREGDPEAGLGTEGGRSTSSTDDSGPKKPGNRVEGKTLTTRTRGQRRTVFDREPAACDGQHTSDPGPEPKPGQPNSRHWGVGGRGREARVAAIGSRLSVMMVQEGARKPEGDARVPRGHRPDRGPGGQSASGFQPKGRHITRQSQAMEKPWR